MRSRGVLRDTENAALDHVAADLVLNQRCVHTYDAMEIQVGQTVELVAVAPGPRGACEVSPCSNVRVSSETDGRGAAWLAVMSGDVGVGCAWPGAQLLGVGGSEACRDAIAPPKVNRSPAGGRGTDAYKATIATDLSLNPRWILKI